MRQAKETGRALYEAIQGSNPGECQDSWGDLRGSTRGKMAAAERHLLAQDFKLRKQEPGRSLYEALHDSDPEEFSDRWEDLGTAYQASMAAAEQSWLHRDRETPSPGRAPTRDTGDRDSFIARAKKAVGAATNKLAGFAMLVVFLLFMAELKFGIVLTLISILLPLPWK